MYPLLGLHLAAYLGLGFAIASAVHGEEKLRLGSWFWVVPDDPAKLGLGSTNAEVVHGMLRLLLGSWFWVAREHSWFAILLHR